MPGLRDKIVSAHEQEAEDVAQAALRVAIQVVRESPYVGGGRFNRIQSKIGGKANERALSGRLGIQLARDPSVQSLEARGIYVDLEYDQMDQGLPKMILGKRHRIDLLVHRRGVPDHNLLVCEVKSHREPPRHVHPGDKRKLEYMTRPPGRRRGPFHYAVGLWISFPRKPGGTCCYARFQSGKMEGKILSIASTH